MGKKIFGTDGIRCMANGPFMNPFFIPKLIFAIKKTLLSQIEKPRIVIAKDTRKSGYMIENALSSAFMALGIHATLVGPIPTPAIPFLISLKNADLGIMISASHNSHCDNGIKIFDKSGFKINDDIENEIEQIILNDDEFLYHNLSKTLATPENIGTLSRIHNTGEQYTDYLLKKIKNDISDFDLSGMKIVIDCANGAGYKTANFLFSKLNANLILINNKPNGLNINENCGAIHPENLCSAVIKNSANLGIAIDGDGDRIVLCDERGEIIDNDKLMIVIAMHLHKKNKLKNNTLVTTILSNKGIESYLKPLEINVHRTNVGDKYIAEAMQKHNFNFGGEKSGHIIFSDYSNSGDGVLSGAFISYIIKKSEIKTSELFDNINLFPQITRNIPYTDSEIIANSIFNNDEFHQRISLLEKDLGDYGRILVRKSGTEKKIRLMAEGADLIKVNLILDNLMNFLNGVIL